MKSIQTLPNGSIDVLWFDGEPRSIFASRIGRALEKMIPENENMTDEIQLNIIIKKEKQVGD